MQYPLCPERVRWLFTTDEWTEFVAVASSYIEGWPVARALRNLISVMFTKNSAYRELFLMFVDKLVLYIARMNEYLSGAWPNAFRIPDEVVNNMDDEKASYKIPTYTVRGTSLVALLNTIVLDDRFEPKDSLNVLWKAESRCAADIAMLRAQNDIFTDVFLDYGVPRKYAPTGKRWDSIIGHYR